MAYALLLARGYDPLDALDTLMSTRQIAATGYAADVAGWYHGAPPGQWRAHPVAVAVEARRRHLIASWRDALIADAAQQP